MRSPLGRLLVRLAAVAFCALGIWISHHLVLKHVESARQGAGQKVAAAPQEKSILDEVCTAALPKAGCDEVISSQWGTIPLGELEIPTALVGLYYFIALICWFALIGSVSRSRIWSHIFIACITACGLWVSVFLLAQMSKLPKWCPLCAAVHLLNLLIFVCVLLLWPRRARVVDLDAAPTPSAPEGSSLFSPIRSEPAVAHDWPHWWMLTVTPVVAVLAMSAVGASLSRGESSEMKLLRQKLSSANEEAATYKKLSEGKEVFKDIEKLRTDLKNAEMARDFYKKAYDRYDSQWQHTFLAWQLGPVVSISTKDDPVRGPQDAPHTLTLFSDFQCPTCKQFEKTLVDRIIPLSKRTGGLKVIFKQWPICTDCNSFAVRNLHVSACEAALAAEAAQILGGNEAFWKMHDALFDNQEEWKASHSFEKYAKAIGLDVEAFKRTMKSEEAMRRVKADIAEGASLGKDLVAAGTLTENEREYLMVDSTPSIFIDNKRLLTAHHFKTWQQILNQPRPMELPVPAATAPAVTAQSRPAATLKSLTR